MVARSGVDLGVGADGSTRMLGLGGAGEVPPGLGVVGGLAAGLGEAERDTRARWHGHGGLGAVRESNQSSTCNFPQLEPESRGWVLMSRGPPGARNLYEQILFSLWLKLYV